jgi:sensor c-di-GMP phosphodiesterase-like protein
VSYGREALSRTEGPSTQVETRIRALLAATRPDPCSDANLALMRKARPRLQLHTGDRPRVGEKLVCSSLGREASGLDLGPLDLTQQPAGFRVWNDVELPFAKGTTFVVLERAGYAAIIHKDLALDVTTDAKDASLAILSAGRGRSSRRVAS